MIRFVVVIIKHMAMPVQLIAPASKHGLKGNVNNFAGFKSNNITKGKRTPDFQHIHSLSAKPVELFQMMMYMFIM